MASTLAALGLFLFTRLDFGVSLKDLSAAALPYEEVSFIISYVFNYSFFKVDSFCNSWT